MLMIGLEVGPCLNPQGPGSRHFAKSMAKGINKAHDYPKPSTLSMQVCHKSRHLHKIQSMALTTGPAKAKRTATVLVKVKRSARKIRLSTATWLEVLLGVCSSLGSGVLREFCGGLGGLRGLGLEIVQLTMHHTASSVLNSKLAQDFTSTVMAQETSTKRQPAKPSQDPQPLRCL